MQTGVLFWVHALTGFVHLLLSHKPATRSHLGWEFHIWQADPGAAILSDLVCQWCRGFRSGVRVLTHQLSRVDGAGRGGKGGILGGECRHGLSGLVTEGLGTRDRGSIRLQWNQVSHLELQRTGAAAANQEGGAAERKEECTRRQAKVEKNAKLCLYSKEICLTCSDHRCVAMERREKEKKKE